MEHVVGVPAKEGLLETGFACPVGVSQPATMRHGILALVEALQRSYLARDTSTTTTTTLTSFARGWYRVGVTAHVQRVERRIMAVYHGRQN